MGLFFNSMVGSAALPAMHDDVTLHYIALWTFVFGAALVLLVMYLRRNVSIRKNVCDCQMLDDRLKNILQHSREALYSFDLKKCRFDYLSPACLSLTGYTPDELEKKAKNGLLSHVHADDREKVLRLIDKLSHQSKAREWLGVVEYRFRHRDGQYRSLSDHLHIRYNSAGEAAVLSGSVREVTQITRLEESMRILERKFQDSQKMAGLGLLASGIAHDFNNLMTVVLGNTELALLDGGGSDGGVLDEIKRTSLRAAELANQMLVYAGKTTTVVNNINLGAVVKEMGSLLDISISKKVNIQYCLDENMPPIRGDISQIRQVAMNLITNASEAIGDQPGVIAISIHAVHLRPGEVQNIFPPGHVAGGTYIQLEVSDTGCGMSEETQQKIFDPLFTTKVTGRGLGLASLLNAVQRHNGVVELQSKLGRGTVFRIYFPVEAAVNDGATQEAFEVDEKWRGYGTALVADDEAAIRDVADALLERLGFRVMTAADGLEMVDLYTEHAEDISLLLVDLNIRRLNGLDAALRIRHINPKVPVLFMSGYPREQVMDRFGEQPHTDCIKKPIQIKELANAVREVMEHSG